jgi:uncharacterized protein
MSGEPVISVRGEAILEVPPEIAVVDVTVQARDKDRATTLDRLARRNQQVLDRIKSYGEAIERIESQPAFVHPEYADMKKPRERITGYVGQAGATVTVSDFTVLGDLVTELADEEMVTIAGPWWRLRPASPVHREARVAAARDATVRAGEYAEAFGGSVTGLLEAADTGLLGAGEARPTSHVVRAAALQSAGMGGHPPLPLDFEPVTQTVTAQVEARFTMSVPDVAAARSRSE